jgi:hypothetical protein
MSIIVTLVTLLLALSSATPNTRHPLNPVQHSERTATRSGGINPVQHSE